VKVSQAKDDHRDEQPQEFAHHFNVWFGRLHLRRDGRCSQAEPVDHAGQHGEHPPAERQRIPTADPAIRTTQRGKDEEHRRGPIGEHPDQGVGVVQVDICARQEQQGEEDEHGLLHGDRNSMR
jgi:hypothetical protein